MKRRNQNRDKASQELEALRQKITVKDDQLESLRQQVDQSWRQLGTLSGLSAGDVKARLLEEAERARSEAERARTEAEQHAAELDQARRRLKTAYKALEYRNTQLETSAAVAREAAGILDVGNLLETTVRLISDRFGFYHAAVFLLDRSGKYAVLRAASSEGGQQLLARGYKLLVGHQGIVGCVAQTGEPSFYAGERSDFEADTPGDLPIPRSEMALPLKARGRIVGVLDVRSTEPEAFNQEEVAILQTLADQVAVALENARLFEQVNRHTRQLMTAAEVSKSAMSVLDLESLMQQGVNLIREAFDLYYVGILLVGEDGKYAVLRASSAKGTAPALPDSDTNSAADFVADSDQQQNRQHPRFRITTHCVVGQCIAEGRALLFAHTPKSDAERECPELLTRPDTRTEMALPLIARGRTIGVLTAQSVEEEAFSEWDIPVFQTMADQIAIALDNAWLFEETDAARAAAKEALKTAQAAQRVAEAANQAKSIFLANMSHELRTPLNAILGFTQLMTRDPNLTLDQRENLETINHSGTHLLSLINDVLEMSKIEAGRTVVTERNFDLVRVLDELETMFRLRANDKGLVLDFICASDVPRYIRSDEGKLRQILINLLGNAVKFTTAGRVQLRVRMHFGGAQSPSDNGDRGATSMLYFAVHDTGPGIAVEDIEGIFDPFTQGQKGRAFIEGTGLGLPISRQFARLMGGDLSVESAVGQGSIFQFEVRVGLVDAAEVQAQSKAREVLGLLPGQHAPDGGPFRLLVVEDRDANRRLLVKLLTALGSPPDGFEVREAIHGEQALAIWEAWEPHLIWMDMRMPVMDGYEATRRIKATPKGQKTVIIALTASAFEEDRAEMLSQGCDDFVRKPFQAAEIFDKMAQHLGVRYRYAEAPVAPEDAFARAGAQAGVTDAALAALPPALLADLERATVETDMLRVDDLIAAVRGHNAGLADALTHLANDFEYGKILQALQRTREAEGQS
ncbi:MAG: GAF domain-containing protein [Anaerolineae bacterium]|nr:GAF domain-containing protein [Anaerolineae bacterium]